jgi:5-methylcytosine-specific restriction endonuclease McrA
MAYEYVPYSGAVVTRAEAKAAGLPRYFTGKPCKNGHLVQRVTADGACPACRSLVFKVDPEKKRAAQKRYEDANREKIRAKGREYSRTHREQANAWHAENRDKMNALAREAYQRKREADPEKLREEWRSYYRRNPEAGVARTIRWQAKNKDKFGAYRESTKEKRAEREKAWSALNPDKRRLYSQRWRDANPEKVGQWQRENPEGRRAIKQARRAREAGAEGTHTAEDIKRIGDAQGWKCHWCKTPTRRCYHVDHIVPLAKGGSNWPSNLAIACPACNQRKHASDPIAFAQRLGLLL